MPGGSQCAECGHVLAWHGDRAIGGCDGGWDRVDCFRRLRVAGEGVALCPCSGWT